MILGIDSDIWFLVRFADKLEETQDKKTAVFKKKNKKNPNSLTKILYSKETYCDRKAKTAQKYYLLKKKKKRHKLQASNWLLVAWQMSVELLVMSRFSVIGQNKYRI